MLYISVSKQKNCSMWCDVCAKAILGLNKNNYKIKITRISNYYKKLILKIWSKDCKIKNTKRNFFYIEISVNKY